MGSSFREGRGVKYYCFLPELSCVVVGDIPMSSKSLLFLTVDGVARFDEE
jgi:hypothetical protein